MNWKVTVAVALAVAACAAAGFFFFGKRGSRPPVTVTLRISVAPTEQTDLVAGKANTALFKYVVGKTAGIKPGLAQKLEVKPLPNSSVLEAKAGVATKEEGQRYADAFVPALQDLCGKQVQLTLAEKTVR